jgi:arylsulfatase A-like enzyme
VHLAAATTGVTRRRIVAGLAAGGALAAVVALLPFGAPADPDPRWNVVVVVTDDQSTASLPHDPPVMPFLQGASSDPSDHWVVFSNAFANTPLCCPSRATLLTGRYAHEHGVLRNEDGPALDEGTTIAAWLDAAGYHTGMVGKYLNQYPFGRAPFVPRGWDRWWGKAQGDARSVYYDYTLIQNGVATPFGSAPTDYLTDVLADRAVEFLAGAPEDEPFLLWFAPTAPHPPWTPAPRHEGAFSDLPVVEPPSVGELDVGDKPAWIRASRRLGPAARAGLVEARRRSFETLLAVDEAIETIVRTLRSRGLLDRTVIVVVSDNGFSFGEHRWVKKSCPYEACTRVPLLIRFPPAAHAVEPLLTSTIDLAPTIAELAAVDVPATVDGSSLLPVLTGGDDPDRPRVVFLEWAGDREVPGWWQVRTADFAYTELVTGERELYDLVRDPDELRNVVDRPAYARAVERLAAALGRFRGG